MDKINLFKYLLYEDKNDIYNNTLNDYIKLNIIQNFDKEIEKMLVYYPECDSLFYFNSIIDYFKQKIEINEVIKTEGFLNYVVNICKITSFDYKEIIKENRTIIYKDINTTMILETYYEDPSSYKVTNNTEEIKTIYIDYISIDENFKINYGKINNAYYNEEYYEVLKLVVKKSEETLKKK